MPLCKLQNLRSATKWGIVFGSETLISSQQSKTKNKLNFKKIPFDCSPLEIFSKLHKKSESAYLLESIEGPKKLAEYSFIGFNPAATIQVTNGNAIMQNEQTGEKTIEKTTDPLLTIRNYVSSNSAFNSEFRLVGGAVGYISYDAIHYWEKIPQTTKDPIAFPDVQVGIYNDGIVFDHRRRQAFYYCFNKNRFKEIKELLEKPIDSERLSYNEPKVNVTKNYFERAVTKAQRYITNGDIFQVVLSKRFEFNFKGDLIEFYHALRKINPSPYMYFLKTGKKQIVGSSPEMLARVDNRRIETFPIAGTRPCRADPKENTRLAEELLADPKERAEHVMLVDLARNDLGRISKFGSVTVPEFMKVHRYSHVQHIVSQVVGDLQDKYDCYDALRAVFPAGTVSGAPKVRAMEIIEELEPEKRGPYAGAVGYFSFNGNADFAITIRTLFAENNKAYIQAGAGIVADSIPEREWFETEHKAGALMKALQIARDEPV